MTFGNKLKSIRKQRGMRQEDLADKIGRQRCTVSNYECNTALPTLFVLRSIASALGTTTDFLLEGVEE